MVQHIPWARVTGFAAAIIALIASGIVLKNLSGILIPFVLAGFLSILFKPLVQFLRAKGVPMAICLILVLIVSGSALWIVYVIVAAGIEAFQERSAFYSQQLQSVIASMNEAVAPMLKRARIKSITWGDVVSAERVTSFATSQLTAIFSVLSDGLMVLLYLMFMLLGHETFPAKVRYAFTDERGTMLLALFRTLNTKVRKYLIVKTAFNLLNGFITWAILAVFGVDFAPLIGLLAFVFHYIPNIGSVISTLIPALLFLLQTRDMAQVAILTAVLTVVHNLIGNTIEPKVMGDRLDLSPVVVLFSLIFWGWMWGIVGMVLSIPIMAVAKALLGSVESTRPLAILMGSGEPPTVELQEPSAP
ncbi:MAG: AI-2E family transporter [Candidatus Kapabacteria bacterium]|nr:AI-2E family transporter [Candidatus Kapabacteria bacterium]